MRSPVFLHFTVAAFCILLAACGSSKDEETSLYDTQAIESLDKMSAAISQLASCSYTLDAIRSRSADSEVHNEHDVYMRSPDKMYLHTVGTRGEKSYWYNGSQLAYYSYSKDQYATIAAPDNILKAVDLINRDYGIDFPAADFFYPDFTDDIIENYSSVLYSEEDIDGITTNHITASNDEEIVQIWVDKATNLPHRMVVESKLDKDKYYDGVFSNWKTNQVLPDSLFAFAPPSNAKQIQLKPIN